MNDEYSPAPRGRRLWLAVVVLAAAVAALAIPALDHVRERPLPVPSPVRATWAVSDNLSVGAGADQPFGLALSPDGRLVAFPAAREGRVRLWLQDLTNGAVTELPGTDGAAQPFWSPDGRRIGFFAGAALRAFELADARVSDLVAVAITGGASWNAAGDLVVGGERGLSLVSASGQRGQSPVTTVDERAGETAHLFPVFLPDGRHLIAFVRAASAARQGIYLIALADGSRTRLTGAAASGLAARGRLVFANDGALVSQALDLEGRRLTGRPLVHGVRVGHSPSGGLFATAAADALIYGEPVIADHQLAWLSRAGERLGTVGSPADLWSVRIAPDGERVAATILDPLLRTLDVVSFDGRSLMPTRVSLSIDADESPAWSPDGLRVAWVQAGHAVMVRGAGAVLPAETVARFDETVRVTDWTPDGAAVIVSRTRAETREDLWVVPVRGDGAPRPLIETPFADVQGDVSPDGRWVAYASDESGRFEIYVERIQDRSPGPVTRERVSSGGGSDPRWSRGGQELFFRRGSGIHVATPALGRGQHALAATSMVLETEVAARSFDVAPNGRRFLLSLPVAGPPPAVTIVINWAQAPKVTTTGP